MKSKHGEYSNERYYKAVVRYGTVRYGMVWMTPSKCLKCDYSNQSCVGILLCDAVCFQRLLSMFRDFLNNFIIHPDPSTSNTYLSLGISNTCLESVLFYGREDGGKGVSLTA